MYGLFLSLLTASADMDACVRAFEEGSLWFGAWAEAGRGDVDQTEMATIVEQVIEEHAKLQNSILGSFVGRL